MTRNDFISKMIRYLLMLFLAVIVFVLGRRVAYGNDCRTCPQSAGCSKVACNK